MSAPPEPRAHRVRRAFWSVLLGALLLQVAYAAVVPAFRGSDEFDHVYKAESVAHGQAFGSVDAPRGRGQLVEVSTGTQLAAQAWCRRYDYTEPDDCRAVAGAGPGRVLVSSAAAAYNPVYYAVVGTVARPFDGESAVWAMRLATMVCASFLLAAAAGTTVRWARTPWPGAALLLSVTPTVVYSASVVAPNGVGYAGAVLWWTAAMGVRRSPDVRHLTTLGVATAVVLVCHSTNPMWVPVMFVALAVLRPTRRWWDLVRASVPARAVLASTVSLTLACLAWAALVGTHATPHTPSGGTAGSASVLPAWSALAANEVAWHLQAIAAFPLRNEALPEPVYLAWGAPLLALLVAGVVAAGARERWAMAGLLVTWLAVPVVLTLRTYTELGFAWQGRYALPLVIGLPVLAATALERRGAPVPRGAGPVLATVTALSQVVCVVHVALQERAADLSTQVSDLFRGGWVAAAVCTVLGAAALSRGLLHACSTTDSPAVAEKIVTDLPSTR